MANALTRSIVSAGKAFATPPKPYATVDFGGVGLSPFGVDDPASALQPFGIDNPLQKSGQFSLTGPQYGMTRFTDRGSAAASFGGFNPFRAQMAQWSQPITPDQVDAALGGMSSLGGDWAGVDQWNSQIQAAASKYGVPANLLKAIMKLESGGQNLGRNGAGAIGPMQVVDTYWGNLGYNLYDPAQNIMAGAHVLKEFYNSYAGWASQNGVDPWKAAVISYYAGNPYNLNARDSPAQGGSGITAGGYGDQIWNDYQTLQRGSLAMGNGGVMPGGQAINSTGFLAVTGGQSYPITQELGGHAMDYSNYDYTLGVSGHPGLDIGTPLGTATYTPVGGTVITAGGTPYFTDQRYESQPGTGELRIQLDNGDQIVLGHMQSIGVRVGQRVTPGMLVGQSGTYNGPHIHMEYLRAGANTSSGFQAVDPRQALSGNFSGTLGGGMTGPGMTKDPGSALTGPMPLGRVNYGGSAGRQLSGPYGAASGRSTIQPTGRMRW